MAADEDIHPLRRHAAPVAACVASGMALGAFFLLNRITAAQAFGAFAAILLGAGLASLLSRPRRANIRPRNETAADEARNMLPALMAALSDPAVALDRDGRVVAMNARMNGIAPAVRVGEPVSIGLRFPEVVEAIRRVAATGRPERVEFVERVAPGRWFETFVNPVAPSADPQAPRPALLLMVFHDLTPIRRIEEMRADFIANASHELRTP
ncbi:MAG: PAS domain-containing protein, partial [Pseudorhodoplanes sp.]